jgi:hypothetical protein
MMQQSKRELLITRLAIASVVLLSLNTVLLLVLLARPAASPVAKVAQADAASSSAASSSAAVSSVVATSTLPVGAVSAGAGVATVEGVFGPTIEPLERALTDFGLDATALMPTDEELQAAIESGSLESAASLVVLEKLRAGYLKVNMPFPDLSVPSVPVAPTPALPSGAAQGAAASSAAPSSGGAGTGSLASGGDASSRDLLGAYFDIMVERIQQHAAKQGNGAELALPSSQEIQEAVATGDIASPQAQAIVSALRTQYEAQGLTFPEPMF